MRIVVVVALVAALAAATAADARVAKKPWPPREGPGQLFVHYGEEHWNDIDGEVVLKQVVADVVRYKPDLVTMSGDKTDDGTTERLTPWLDIMAAYDRGGVPYMAGVGNHDGKQATPEPVTEAAAGSTPLRDITFYKQVFAGRPYPMGDAAPYPGFSPTTRPPDDPAGASTHFHIDARDVRWIFLDNSCYGIVNCDPLQNPPDGRGRDQYQYLADNAAEATAAGKLVFVVMHMPTRDPRDQEHAYYTSVNHVMGKGISPDNQEFERRAAQLGIDGVFLGHIKGQVQYVGEGGVPYYIDGGAGGELYSAGPLGIEHGYWYGWRMIRVDGKTVTHDVIPVITPGSLILEGPASLPVGGPEVVWQAWGSQPAAKSDRAVVKQIELRDPDPIPKGSRQSLPPWLPWLLPLLLVPAVALMPRVRSPRRLVPVPVAVVLLGGTGLALAQRSEPTATPKDALPNPSRIFTSGDGNVLAAVPSRTDDHRRDPKAQTADGRFRPACPGRTTLTVTTGHEETSTGVRVMSGAGRILKSVSPRRRVRRARRAAIATVRLSQPAVVEAKLVRGKRTVARTERICLKAGTHRLRARVRSRGAAQLRVTVRSDRPILVRKYAVRIA